MKHIIITGAGSGFGLRMAKTLAMEGHNVFACMRNISGSNAIAALSLTQWAKDNLVDLHVMELDVTDNISVKAAVRNISKQTNGVIDVLINNAGTAYIGLNETISADQADAIFQVNVIGADRMIKEVLPVMHRRKEGLLITISSVASRQYTPLFGAYAASKSAIDALSVSYFYELRSMGIDVAIIQPGAYPNTSIVNKQMSPAHADTEKLYGEKMASYKEKVLDYFSGIHSQQDPQEVADLAAWLISAPRESRPLWNLVGAGKLSGAIDHINECIREIADTITQEAGL